MKKSQLLALMLALLTLSGCADMLITGIPQVGTQVKTPTDLPYETKIVKVETFPDIAYVYPWEERTNDDRFPEFELEGIEYRSAGMLTDAVIGETLGRVTLKGYDHYLTAVNGQEIDAAEHETSAAVYPIEGIDGTYALALSFEGDETLYVYRNHSYTVENLAELTDALALPETLAFGSVYQNYFNEENEYISLEFVGARRERVWELLFSDRSITASDHYDHFNDDSHSMSISVSAPLLGHHNKSVTVTESGYLWTNLIDTGVAFFIGEEAANAFMHYITSECKGYQIIYDDGIDHEPSDGEEAPATTVRYNNDTPATDSDK